MTSEERARLRTAIDAHRRAELLPVNDALAGRLFCTACRMEMDNWTPGCETCADRWNQWRRQGKVSMLTYAAERERGEGWRHHCRVIHMRRIGRRTPPGTWATHRERQGLAGPGFMIRLGRP